MQDTFYTLYIRLRFCLRVLKQAVSSVLEGNRASFGR